MSPEDDVWPPVGLTGARFGGAPGRRGRRRRAGPPEDTATEAIAIVEPVRTVGDGDAEGQVVGLTGARFAGSGQRRARRPAAAPATPAVEAAEPAPAQPVPQPDPEPHPELSPLADPSTSIVRPYVLTQGRTRPRVELVVEALVCAVPAVDPGPHRAVVDLCREPRSVAEVAALLAVPLGVARVLLGDLAASGAVVVHRTVGASGPDVELMERVLAGLRRL